ncbi:MAG: inosine-uridine nucleoside N-ribohydrolase [Pirellulaceae bacterium]|jgi:inosine-uridine nucleoside N-ribohydrolase
MARKIIIDCDPGIDDAVALCHALFESRLEVVAVTAVAGNVPAGQASRNVQTIIERLDPPRFPRVGVATPAETTSSVNAFHFHGSDGLGNANFPVSQLHHQHLSEKVISDLVRAHPGQVTIICLGPLTNIARAFQRDPQLPELVDQLIITGGSVASIGNVTPTAEFNMHYDPVSAREVFRSPTTKTLIPLDVTQKLRFNFDFVEELPSEDTKAGAFLRKILPFSFRAHHQLLGQESIFLHDVISVVAAIHPELFEMAEMAGDVEISGDLTIGATIFDQRRNRDWGINMEVATAVDTAAVKDCILRGLSTAAK